MPKDVICYSNTIIYKIYCNDKLVTDIYVGHTTNFIKRKYQHKILCNAGKNLKVYNLIRQNGGWDNWTMMEIAKYNCQDATEARIREQEHYDLLNPSLNLVKPISNNEYTVLQIDNNIKINDELKICNKKFYCKICDYNTCRKSQYDRHLSTSKHINTTNTTNTTNLVHKSSNAFICECGNEYKHHSSLWNHKKKM